MVKLIVLFFLSVSVRAEVHFSVEPNRAQMGLEETLSLKFSLEMNENLETGDPQYEAPDFDLLNEIPSQSYQSLWENGRATLKVIKEVTLILKPKKIGNLEIKGLRIKAGSQVYRAEGMKIKVEAQGAGAPPPRGYGGSGVGLRGSGKSNSVRAFFTRAEVNKQKLYKGEQLVVSYYLYRRVKVFNAEATKYPVLSGFLKEELETPLQGTRLDSQQVVVDGVTYLRSPLARYAAYPIKEGSLQVDPLAIRFQYMREGGHSSFGQDEEDPFAGFFNRMTPLVATSQSDPISIEVLNLPEEGKPDSFTGGVGDFSLAAAVDRYELHANEAITLTIKIEGHGNVASIEEPKAHYPDGVEVFDTKGKSKSSTAGVGEKIFEIVLIPRVSGKLTLPGVRVSFFDPSKKTYVTRVSSPIEIQVLAPLQGTVLSVIKPRQNSPILDEMPLLKPLDFPYAESQKSRLEWELFAKLTAIALLVLMIFVGFDVAKGVAGSFNKENLEKRKLFKSKRWDKLEQKANRKEATSKEVTQNYELLSGALYDVLDRVYSPGTRALPQIELKKILIEEKGVSENLWLQIAELLEYAEMVRFASSAGAVSEREAREKLSFWVKQGREIEAELSKLKNK